MLGKEFRVGAREVPGPVLSSGDTDGRCLLQKQRGEDSSSSSATREHNAWREGEDDRPAEQGSSGTRVSLSADGRNDEEESDQSESTAKNSNGSIFPTPRSSPFGSGHG